MREAEKHLLMGLELCERIQLLAWITGARFILGELYFELGDFTKSKEHYEKGISVLENSRLLPSWAGLSRVGVARSKVMNKEKDVNLESLAVHYRNNKVKMFDGWIQRYMGEIFLNCRRSALLRGGALDTGSHRSGPKERHDAASGKRSCPMCGIVQAEGGQIEVPGASRQGDRPFQGLRCRWLAEKSRGRIRYAFIAAAKESC